MSKIMYKYSRDRLTWPDMSWDRCYHCVHRLEHGVAGSCKANWCMQGPVLLVMSLHIASSCK